MTSMAPYKPNKKDKRVTTLDNCQYVEKSESIYSHFEGSIPWLRLHVVDFGESVDILRKDSTHLERHGPVLWISKDIDSTIRICLLFNAL